MKRRISLGLALCCLALLGRAESACPPAYQDGARALHAEEWVDFCQFAGRPLLVINTASHCGFTGQFEGLEALWQEFGPLGLQMLGVPSDDFLQEAARESETAEVCRVKYGVTFPMTTVQKVRGRRAHPLFRDLARQERAPRWNFYKYLLDGEGRVVQVFNSRVTPEDPALKEAIRAALRAVPQ